MKSARAWKWGLVVLSTLTFVATSGFLVVQGYLPSLVRWGVADRSRVQDLEGESVSLETVLPEAEADRLRDFQRSMMDPAKSIEGAGQLRAYVEELIKQGSATAPLSMAVFLEGLGPKFPSLDEQARQVSLALLSDFLGWFGENPTTCWAAVLGPSKVLVSSALEDPSREITLAGLEIVRASWDWSPPEVKTPAERKRLGTWKASLHTLCLELLESKDEQIRLAAGVAVVSAPIESAAAKGLGLLADESPAVRRAMLLALSDRPALLPSEEVLGFLRDPNSLVQSTADIVLTSRGLTREQIALASRATDDSAMVRAQSVLHIVHSSAVDRAVWLTHLSRDDAAQVRREAARGLAVVGGEDCMDRLTEMAEIDPDLEVRKLAGSLVRGEPLTSESGEAEAAGVDPSNLPTLVAPKAN